MPHRVHVKAKCNGCNADVGFYVDLEADEHESPRPCPNCNQWVAVPDPTEGGEEEDTEEEAEDDTG